MPNSAPRPGYATPRPFEPPLNSKGTLRDLHHSEIACRIGDHAFIGMGALVNGDVPPFVMVAQDGYGRPRGINAEGLRRRGFDAQRMAAIKRAYRALYMSGAKLEEARAQLAEMAKDSADVRLFLEFIERGERPLLR